MADELQLSIEKLVYGGDGLGHAEGNTVFVPYVLPGEELSVSIIKEGKEPNQGIAYLDDGTMVVVENAKRHIGSTVQMIVGSVYQTVAGKMVQ